MQIVTPKQMGKIEDSSENLGVSKKQLMANAGKKLAEFIENYFKVNEIPEPENKSIVFLAGAGNNGGDCFASARELVYKGYGITVINVIGEPKTNISSDMFNMLPDRVNIITGYTDDDTKVLIKEKENEYNEMSQTLTIEQLSKKDSLTPLESAVLNEKIRNEKIRSAIVSADVLVDGVFGTGFHGQLDREISQIFSIGTSAYKIAVDVPSGGESYSGTASDNTFKADETLALGFIKTGMTQYPLKSYCGKITVADIGIPVHAMEAIDGKRKYFRIERNQLANFPPSREKNSHKGTYGKVLVIAGSSSMRGASAFAVLGALRSGTGLVQLASTEKCIDTVSVLAPEAIFVQLASDENGFMLFEPNKEKLLKAMENANAVVIGCGMGHTDDTCKITKFVTQNAKCPVLIDADGINCIASDIEILTQKNTDIIITPHMGEMARLAGCDINMIAENRFLAAEKYAEQFEITVILKGAGTIISNGKTTAANHTGNPGMSRGGSGDILSGIIGSIIAQGYNVFDASCAGVYIHGLAGDACAERLGQEAMLPRDIIDSLSESFMLLKEKHRIN